MKSDIGQPEFKAILVFDKESPSRNLITNQKIKTLVFVPSFNKVSSEWKIWVNIESLGKK